MNVKYKTKPFESLMVRA